MIIIGNVVGTRNDVCDVCEWSVGGRSENMVVIEDRVSLEICTMHVKLRIAFDIGGRKQHCEVKKKPAIGISRKFIDGCQRFVDSRNVHDT